MKKIELTDGLNVYEIIDYDGKHHEYIRADNDRQALCLYLINHEELTDMMLWKSTDFLGGWRLAKYDNEDEGLRARKAKR